MNQSIALVALVVRDYDEALDFYLGTLGFMLVEDTPVPEQAKRWVVVAPSADPQACRLLLAKGQSHFEQLPRGTVIRVR